MNKRGCVKYRYSWDTDDSDERRLTQILFIINKINLRQSACSASSASVCVFRVICVR